MAKPIKKTAEQIRKEILEATSNRASDAKPISPQVQMKKIFFRMGLFVALLWIVCAALYFATKSFWWIGIAATLNMIAIGVVWWIRINTNKGLKLQSILQGAQAGDEGRRDALVALERDFKKDDAAAAMTKAQLELQEDPRKALATLEAVDLKGLSLLNGQVRAMRATIHLQLNETIEAKALVADLDLSKQQDPKLRVMLAAVAAETWARTGQAKKALDTLDLFKVDDPLYGDLSVQLLRARAFTYAHLNDSKGVIRTLKKMTEINPHLVEIFLHGGKKVHPLLERESKLLVLKLGLAPKMKQQIRIR